MGFVRTLGGGIPRSGRHDRVNNDRYFHVMGQGWYALAREGLGGPFIDKQEAEAFVHKAMAGELLPKDQDSEDASW
ncbi:MAG: hypothetical protein RI563_04660 [Thiohalophilus sp.]|uniref:hypothetical protein n=1 Tax=Thiohalophilus sp. TaxID=3028392 RepID=UPI00287037D0|nr:hypothetical protein [Thiohalophilus sp.]MDR9436143.1 hypothetical protein [Thiohalophilus sp.]